MAWFDYMQGALGKGWEADIVEVLNDVNVKEKQWIDYMNDFVEYHGI